jgi:hypothetical protein
MGCGLLYEWKGNRTLKSPPHPPHTVTCVPDTCVRLGWGSCLTGGSDKRVGAFDLARERGGLDRGGDSGQG